MRKRQISCMHGGYRKYQGSGIIMDFNTAKDRPTPTNDPTKDPTKDPPTGPPNKSTDLSAYIGAIVGLGVTTLGFAASTKYYYNKANDPYRVINANDQQYHPRYPGIVNEDENEESIGNIELQPLVGQNKKPSPAQDPGGDVLIQAY